MDTYFAIIGLTYFVIGFAVAMLFYYVLRRPFLGNFLGGLIVGLVGSFLGGTLDFLLLDFDMLTLGGTVDVVPPVVTSVVLVWTFSGISRRESR